ncbi:MAG: hypothetical protein AB7T06_35345 [Kofleriaceae bacterium]
MQIRRSLLVLLVTVAACGDDGSSPGDGGPNDMSIVIDIDNGSCGDTVRLTGEYVDWFTEVSFCGINEAVFEVEGDGPMDSTAPNGRFDLCTPDQPGTRLNITQPAGNSQCTVPPSDYTIPTILFARKDVIQAGAFYSVRSWTTAKQAEIFTASGTTFDGTKAQVHVHVDGNPRAVSIAAAHGTAQAIAMGGATWSAGSTGVDVFFPNVDVGSGQTMLTVTGSAVGAGNIPLVAGTLTNVTVLAL